MGCCWISGEGVEHDCTKAVRWYRKAAEQGHAGAQCNLGCCYFNGYGVKQNREEAVCWRRKAAEQGHAHAKEFLKLRERPGMAPA
ncbi:MAG: sel1 repeat family protein [Akkermansia sp.]|nr:sel1 repeat family protein [Akkermansia sp.]